MLYLVSHLCFRRARRCWGPGLWELNDCWNGRLNRQRLLWDWHDNWGRLSSA